MHIFILFAVFESFLFPRTHFLENQFNPATLYQNSFTIRVGTEVRFGLSELRTHTIDAHIRSYGLSAATFGNDLYRENVMSLGFGFPIVETFAVGFSVAVLNYWVKHTENHFSYSLKIGGVFHRTPVEASAWISNVNVPKFSEIDYLPPNYSLRVAYSALYNLSFYFALRGIETELPFFNVGFFYAPYRMITIGMGVHTDPLLFEYGLEIYVGEFLLNYSGSNHPKLGLSHYVGAGFRL